MTDREILNKVYRWVTMAYERNDKEHSQERFKDLKEFIERERAKKNDDGGGWL